MVKFFVVIVLLEEEEKKIFVFKIKVCFMIFGFLVCGFCVSIN